MQHSILELDKKSYTCQRLRERPYRIHYLLEDINPLRDRLLWRFNDNRILVRHNLDLDLNRLQQTHPTITYRSIPIATEDVRTNTSVYFDILAYIRRRPVTGKWVVQQPNQYLDWFKRISFEHGFRVDTVQSVKVPSYFVRTSSLNIQLQPVELVGHLEILDVPKFQDCLANGLGRMRSFGCGLLLLKGF